MMGAATLIAASYGQTYRRPSMKIKYTVDDGYAGPERPHYINVSDDEFEDMSDEERDSYVDEMVNEDYQRKFLVKWTIVE